MGNRISNTVICIFFPSIFRAIARDVKGALSIGEVIIANGHFVILSAKNQLTYYRISVIIW